jgi:hypothetical protein
LIEAFGHARFDGAFGNVEDIGDFAKFEILVMTQDDDGAVMFGQTLEGVADEFGLFVRLKGGVGREIGGGLAIEIRERFVAIGVGIGVLDFEGSFGASLEAAKFVVAKIHRDAP